MTDFPDTLADSAAASIVYTADVSHVAVIAASLPVMTVELVAETGEVVEIAADLPVPEVDMVILWGGSVVIDLNAQCMVPEIAMTGVVGEVVGLAAELQVPTMVLNILTGQVGTIDLAFPAEWADVALTITGQSTGTLNLVWPTPTVEMTIGEAAPAPAAVNSALYAMNTKVLGVTQYASLGITSLCVCSGKLYGTGKDGLYEFSGSSEGGALIEKRGMDFGTPKEKRITDGYALVQSTGPYKIRITSSGKTGTVTCADGITELHGSKVSLPRGIAGRVFDWAFFTEEASEFELTAQELLLDVSNRNGRQNR